MEPRVGGKIDLHFQHRDLSDQDDPIPEKYKGFEEGSESAGKVTQWDPPRILSYTWAEESGTDSEVTFELKSRGDKVLLILTHRLLGDDPEMLLRVAAGWHTHLGILIDRLSGRNPQGFWKVHTRLEEEYKDMILKRQ